MEPTGLKTLLELTRQALCNLGKLARMLNNNLVLRQLQAADLEKGCLAERRASRFQLQLEVLCSLSRKMVFAGFMKCLAQLTNAPEVDSQVFTGARTAPA